MDLGCANGVAFGNSPSCPKEMVWANHFPKFFPAAVDGTAVEAGTCSKKVEVEVADIGCGFGGLIVSLAPKLPDTLMLGGALQLFTRWQVADF